MKDLLIVKRLQIGLRRHYRCTVVVSKYQKYYNITNKNFRKYIDSQLLEGMTFDNYCKVWNLDHIVPVFLFDLTKEDELKLCYNYQNIMPMYRKDNKYKGGSVHFSLELLKCKEQTPIVKALLERCQSEIDNRYNKYKPTS